VAYGYCGDPHSTNVGFNDAYQAPPNTSECTTGFLDVDQLKTDFASKCTTKNSCDFRAIDYLIPDAQVASEYLPLKDTCTTQHAKIYMQYKCEQNKSELNAKREKGLAVSICACIAALVFLVVIFYMKKMAILDFQMWDMKTLTASDFTVEMTVTEALWNQFIVNLANHKDELPMGKAAPDHKTHKGLPVVTFEAFLEEKLTAKLNKVPAVNKECDITIANITFGFDNPKLLNELVARGGIITSGKLEKL